MGRDFNIFKQASSKPADNCVYAPIRFQAYREGSLNSARMSHKVADVGKIYFIYQKWISKPSTRSIISHFFRRIRLRFVR
ncbi:hypothetical protein M514_07042 [Trichuris suis]|uniref:Uncharacterized protein n=1 Tax=Trichuris suis TaxID=68888 RepID=A0A085N8S7_9BILA|nr:hypothetical protein M513_07042 [Trichuris suis]KFD65873.1 hypothetical protein M514_07042 [Trichuris suis]